MSCPVVSCRQRHLVTVACVSRSGSLIWLPSTRNKKKKKKKKEKWKNGGETAGGIIWNSNAWRRRTVTEQRHVPFVAIAVIAATSGRPLWARLNMQMSSGRRWMQSAPCTHFFLFFFFFFFFFFPPPPSFLMSVQWKSDGCRGWTRRRRHYRSSDPVGWCSCRCWALPTGPTHQTKRSGTAFKSWVHIESKQKKKNRPIFHQFSFTNRCESFTLHRHRRKKAKKEKLDKSLANTKESTN